MEVTNNQLKFNITLELDEKWASNFSTEELREYLKSRLNYSLGFRGHVKKLSKPRQRQK